MADVQRREESEIGAGLPLTKHVLLKLFLHTVAMLTLPFWVYFKCRDYAQQEFGIEPHKSYIYGAVAAVVVIQAVIFSYVYQAYREEQQTRKAVASAKRD